MCGWYRSPDAEHDDLPRSLDDAGAGLIALTVWFLACAAIALAACLWPLVLA
jgi:hypothetical protein